MIALIKTLVLAALGATFLAPPLQGQEFLRIHFLDVGQGDAVLVQSPTGQNVLYDAGPPGADIVGHLRRLGVESLDLAIASHGHADHIGGMADVLRAYRPRFYMDNGAPHAHLAAPAACELGAERQLGGRRRLVRRVSRVPAGRCRAGAVRLVARRWSPRPRGGPRPQGKPSRVTERGYGRCDPPLATGRGGRRARR